MIKKRKQEIEDLFLGEIHNAILNYFKATVSHKTYNNILSIKIGMDGLTIELWNESESDKKILQGKVKEMQDILTKY